MKPTYDELVIMIGKLSVVLDAADEQLDGVEVTLSIVGLDHCNVIHTLRGDALVVEATALLKRAREP